MRFSNGWQPFLNTDITSRVVDRWLRARDWRSLGRGSVKSVTRAAFQYSSEAAKASVQSSMDVIGSRSPDVDEVWE